VGDMSTSIAILSFGQLLRIMRFYLGGSTSAALSLI